MAAPALAPQQVQQLSVTRRKPKLTYTRGLCPGCKKPMLVVAAMPNAPCSDCYVK